MIVFLNGRLVPEAEALVSVFDRGFLYGDGLFETMRVRHGRIFRWHDHFARLAQGAGFLRLRLPVGSKAMLDWARKLITRNAVKNGMLRLTVSRGVGIRGYSPKGADRPALVMSLHQLSNPNEVSEGCRLITSSVRLPANEPIARYKTCNKLPQIIARAEAEEAGADEALLLNTEGCVVEASSANLFWVQHGGVCTPPVSSGILPGITRKVVLELCQELRIKTWEGNARLKELQCADGVFLSLSSAGVVECISLDGQVLNRSSLVQNLSVSYHRLLERETSPQ